MGGINTKTENIKNCFIRNQSSPTFCEINTTNSFLPFIGSTAYDQMK